MKNKFLKFGLYSALLGMVLMGFGLLAGRTLNYASQQVLGFVIIIATLVLAIYFGIKKLRDEWHQGYLNFGKAFMYGLLLTFFVGLGIAFMDYIYTQFINPDFYSNYMDYYLETLKNTLSAEEFNIKKAEIEAAPDYQKAAWFMALGMYFATVFWGFFVSLAMAMILKKQKEN